MKKKNIILTSIFLPIVALITIFVVLDLNFIRTIDIAVFDIVHSLRNKLFDYIMVIITLFGEVKTIVVLCVLVLLIPKNQKIVLPAIICLVLSTITNTVLKDTIERARPGIMYFLENPPFNYEYPTSFSFPSGHSQNGFLFYFLMFFVFSKKYLKNYKHKKALTISVMIFILLIPFSRIYLGVHYFTDVICGLSLGVVFAAWFIYFFNKYENKLIGSVNNDSNKES